MAPGPAVCPRATCALTRPSESGWPGFFSFGDVVDERYRVEEILGAGGAGVTYRCVDLINGEQTALKVLHPDRKRGTLANRLVIEGEVLELLDHPHIVPFRALKIVGEGAYYLATLHMAGGSMDRFVRRNGPLSPVGTVTAARQLAMGLDFVHAGGIVHRDLKPANVLLEVDDPDHPVMRLADFGIARMFRDPRPLLGGLTRTGAFIGTPEYAAPEQIRGEKGIGPAADAFAFGALLHFAASGQALLQRDDIVDWKAFKERRWDPSQRPRLAALVEAEDAEGAEALQLLDSAIDALMHRVPAQRLDLGTAAMRFGANPAQLAPLDQPVLAPPTLSGATAEELEEVFQSVLDPDALIPNELPGGDTTESNAIVALPFGPSPARELDDDDDDDFTWPTREQRRDRRHSVAAVAFALLVGSAFAYPGGPGALLGPERAASLGSIGAVIVERLGTEATSYEPRDAAEAPLADPAREPLRRTRTMPVKRTPQRAAALPVPPPRRPAAAPSEPAPEPGREAEGVAVESSRRAAAAPTVVEVEPVRGWKPRARLSEPAPLEPSEPEVEPAPAPSPASAPAFSHLDAWVADRGDNRPLSEVLGQVEAEHRDGFGYEEARRALQDDERAARWLLEAREQDMRVDRMRSQWEVLQQGARQLRDSDDEDAFSDEDAIDLDVGILESLFPAEPRIDPMATTENCD